MSAALAEPSLWAHIDLARDASVTDALLCALSHAAGGNIRTLVVPEAHTNEYEPLLSADVLFNVVRANLGMKRLTLHAHFATYRLRELQPIVAASPALELCADVEYHTGQESLTALRDILRGAPPFGKLQLRRLGMNGGWNVLADEINLFASMQQWWGASTTFATVWSCRAQRSQIQL